MMSSSPASESRFAPRACLLSLAILLATATAAGPARAECDPRGGSFAGFSGDYRIDLETSDTTFEDFLEVREITRHPGMANAREEFEGTYTVPNRFSVPVEDGVLVLSASDPEHDLSMTFRIDAAENGTVYPVFFRFTGKLREPCEMTGSASYDAEGDRLLGEARLVKLPVGCHCGERR